MSVHYKFKSALEYDTVTFDGLHISVKDLKNAIIQQKRIGKGTDFDLQVTNAQTKEVYQDDNTLIPKNTSLLIARIPNAAQNKPKQWEGYSNDSTPPAKTDELGAIAKAVDLSSIDAPEDDKIKAMMSQSTQDYDPSNYMKIRGANQVGAVPPNYRCYKCHMTGHWIKDCPLSQGTEPIEIKKSTGIPRSFMVPVDGPDVPGAMMTPNGQYAVPVLDHEAYNQKPTPVPPVQEPKPEIPEELVCSICSDLLTDAVMIPCCGNSFCDECIRSCLLESEDHECPDCHEKDISPGTLIPNRFLRTSVGNFKNTTGYVKKPVYRPPRPVVEPKKVKTPPPIVDPVVGEKPSEDAKTDIEKKTIISEADSTEPSKANANVDFAKDIEIEPPVKMEVNNEGPPGVSPKESPKGHAISNRISTAPRERTNSSKHHKKSSREPSSPRRRHRSSHHSPAYSDNPTEEDRPGTPTVDEPGNGYTNNRLYPTGPPTAIPPMVTVGPPPIQGPPPQVPPYPIGQQPPVGPYPTPAGPPPPNFRLPPPGSGPPPYLPPGPYSVPPRPYFDGTRPPMTGPPPFAPGYTGPRHHRDFNDRRMRNRTPPGVIDDPLAAFNRMLREKDERERRAKQRNLRRSYSRSRSKSRSRSFSRSPRRMRSRSPRRRQSRSRSRSFSISRSRSRSFTGSTRGSPFRDLSPRHSPPPRRRGPSRYRSPIRSPPRHRAPPERRDRDFDRDRDLDRNFERDDYRDRGRMPPDRDRGRDMRDRDRDFHYYDGYDDRNRNKPPQWNQGMAPRPHPDPTYYPPGMPPQHPYPAAPPNRYPGRDYPPPYMKSEPHVLPTAPLHMPPMRKMDDIAPPGVDEPPIPGIEDEPKRIEEEIPQRLPEKPVSPVKDYRERGSDRREREKNNDKPERPSDRRRDDKPDRKRRYGKHTPSPERQSETPQRKSADKESPDKHKRKRRDDSSDHDRKRDHSEDERYRKSRDKKKKKERKDSDKKRRKERKEKHDKHEKHEKHKKEEKERDKEKEKEKKSRVKSEERKEDTKQDVSPPKHTKEVVPKDKTPEVTREEEKTPVKKVEHEQKPSLYNDVISEDLEKHVVVENYVKYDPESVQLRSPSPKLADNSEIITIKEPDGEDIEIKDEDSEKDILEIHTNDIMDLKTELEAKNEVLAPVPEKSKWEVDDDSVILLSPSDLKSDSKLDKSGKVTNEVLKRAENAIFAKAINAIRPIEIKKISMDRAKLYSGERDVEKKSDDMIQVTIQTKDDKSEHKRIEPPPLSQPIRISVKDRLGVKVEDTDKIIRLDKSPSPFHRRVELENRRRQQTDRSRRSRSRGDRHPRVRENRLRDIRSRDDYVRRDRDQHRRDHRGGDDRRGRSRRDEPPPSSRHAKHRSSGSVSEDKKDKRKKKDSKKKKEKSKKHHKDEDEKKTESSKLEKEVVEVQCKPKTATEKRKPTLDEANFEPDYDLESESDKDEPSKISDRDDSPEDEKSSSSSTSSESSSEEERKKKKHKKHKKRRSRKESSSSSSDSDSDSSEDEKERRKRKHKKKQKKKKKSKHR